MQHRRNSWTEMDKIEQEQSQGHLNLGRGGGVNHNHPCCKTDPNSCHCLSTLETVVACLSNPKKGLWQTALPLCIIFTLMLLAKILSTPHIISLMHDAKDQNVSFRGASFLSIAQFNQAERNRILAEADRITSSSPEINKGAGKKIRSKSEQIDLWQNPKSVGFGLCIGPPHPRTKRVGEGANGYILVNANGGLNQMRHGICDMVAIAKILNASLVVPYLDHSSFWADPSEFKDIFDVQHFMDTLAYDVHIAPSLPPWLGTAEIPQKTPGSWSKAPYYMNRITLLLKKNKAPLFTHSDSRLSNNGLPRSIQGLRCRACYKALRFTDPIQKLGEKLVHRMSWGGATRPLHSSASQVREGHDRIHRVCNWAKQRGGPGIARDAVQDTALEGEEDRWGEEAKARGMPPHPSRNCETALLLIALGYPRSSHIYIVAGEIYGKGSMDVLRTHFANTFTHSTLATAQELLPLSKYQNRLAALDYTVALESDGFLYTYGGNMAKAVQGHRRFAGHRKTISPDRRRLVQLVDDLDDGRITWLEFETKVRRLHQGGPEPRQVGRSQHYFYSNLSQGAFATPPDMIAVTLLILILIRIVRFPFSDNSSLHT